MCSTAKKTPFHTFLAHARVHQYWSASPSRRSFMRFVLDFNNVPELIKYCSSSRVSQNLPASVSHLLHLTGLRRFLNQPW